MIGDQHIDAACACRGHAGDAGNAVVDGDDQLRRRLKQSRDQGRAQPITVRLPIRHAVADPLRAKQAQAADGHGRAAGAVAIEITDNDDLPVVPDRAGQQLAGLLDATQRRRAGHGCESVFDLGKVDNATRRVDPAQDRMHGLRPVAIDLADRPALDAGRYQGCNPRGRRQKR